MEARFVLRNLFAIALLISFLDLPLLLAQYPGARRGHANYQASTRNFTVNYFLFTATPSRACVNADLGRTMNFFWITCVAKCFLMAHMCWNFRQT